MARATNKHIHQYVRVNIGKKAPYIVYKCAVPNCSHYLQPELVTGKLSICPHCETAFVIEKKHLELARPHCDECVNPNHWKVNRKENTPDRVEISSSLGDLLVKTVEKQKEK